jgi:hypothetical protein
LDNFSKLSKTTHPHPNLPLEGEGTKSSIKLAHLGLRGIYAMSHRLRRLLYCAVNLFTDSGDADWKTGGRPLFSVIR